jgi:hypothetical protein
MKEGETLTVYAIPPRPRYTVVPLYVTIGKRKNATNMNNMMPLPTISRFREFTFQFKSAALIRLIRRTLGTSDATKRITNTNERNRTN